MTFSAEVRLRASNCLAKQAFSCSSCWILCATSTYMELSGQTSIVTLESFAGFASAATGAATASRKSTMTGITTRQDGQRIKLLQKFAETDSDNSLTRWQSPWLFLRK
eukprot:CAMPEP_0202813298 /NCGR_PEP_ID=MMETSP1389-20130828/4699_1 /ASSEMBLY_ACC=CAM_ASM_000865 /TAXON_ID=302021 /ORGANISM="Rhodomonas sp., Strain CCMP768" /LENGTH=107 /DNA_ID=CAMNT_0049484859 /DNA_START=210 /DNA_END=533 /DNA_ORIENTATION=+